MNAIFFTFDCFLIILLFIEMECYDKDCTQLCDTESTDSSLWTQYSECVTLMDKRTNIQC
jgi:hypothetical protein